MSEQTKVKEKSSEIVKVRRLTEGPVLPVLFKLALPIVGASFVQMAYNLTDMFWVGVTGPKSMSAVGVAGFYIWLSMAFITLVRVGTEVRVSHRTGAHDDEGAKQYARTGIFLTTLIAVFYAVTVVLLREPLIGIFRTEPEVHAGAVDYLVLSMIGMPFAFLNPVLGAIFNSKGYSSFAFFANLAGTLVNFVVDPLFITGFGPIPAMGVAGAALATILAQLMVTAICFYVLSVRRSVFPDFALFHRSKSMRFAHRSSDIMKLGVAPAIYSAVFTMIGIVIGILVSSYGTEANAVQKLGSQIESLSWMTASGISYALTAFVGQNIGAKQFSRVREGYILGLKLCISLGILSTVLFYFFGEFFFYLFIRDENVIRMGADYLRILALSQLLMCVEITCTGVFNGLGLTRIPAASGVLLNLIRIPLAYALVTTSLGLNGIWWAITISSWLKGLVLFFFLHRRMKHLHEM